MPNTAKRYSPKSSQPLKRKPVVGSTQRTATSPQLELQPYFPVTDTELAIVTRLIRVMRKKHYRGVGSLGPFLKWLVYQETKNPFLGYFWAV